MSLNADKEVEFYDFSEVPEKCNKCIPNMQQEYTEVHGNGFVSSGNVLGLPGLCYSTGRQQNLFLHALSHRIIPRSLSLFFNYLMIHEQILSRIAFNDVRSGSIVV